MDTFYVRHTRKMDVDQVTHDYLWNKQLVGIHFPHRINPVNPDESDNDSTNPDDYPQPGKSAMAVFTRLGKSGGYVLAEYWKRPGCLIGLVEPGTQIEIYRGKWGNLWKREGREAILKTLKLSRVQKISEAEATKFLAGRPRQGTAMQWHSVGKMIENRILGLMMPLTVRDLIPTFQEVLCAEFLRLPTEITGLPQLASLLLPVGRTLRGLDIYAIDTTGKILACQVTLQASANCPSKVESLKILDDANIKRIFFCDDTLPRIEDGIQYFPLNRAFLIFSTTSHGKQWVSEISR